MSLIHDLVKSESTPTHEPKETVCEVENYLRDVWRDSYDVNLANVKKVAVDLFGSVEKAESFFTSKGWSRNPKAQARAVMLLNRIARRVKK